MNELDQSDVAYKDGPKEARESGIKGNKQFPGNKMPQTNNLLNRKRGQQHPSRQRIYVEHR